MDPLGDALDGVEVRLGQRAPGRGHRASARGAGQLPPRRQEWRDAGIAAARRRRTGQAIPPLRARGRVLSASPAPPRIGLGHRLGRKRRDGGERGRLAELVAHGPVRRQRVLRGRAGRGPSVRAPNGSAERAGSWTGSISSIAPAMNSTTSIARWRSSRSGRRSRQGRRARARGSNSTMSDCSWMRAARFSAPSEANGSSWPSTLAERSSRSRRTVARLGHQDQHADDRLLEAAAVDVKQDRLHFRQVAQRLRVLAGALEGERLAEAQSWRASYRS